jgi:hypothetical protein
MTPALWLLALAVPACAQVLDLERAQLEAEPQQETAPSLTGLGGVPTQGAACETAPAPACVQCWQRECEDTRERCAADPDCRLELDKYAICLGRRCTGEQESCYMNLVDPELRSCLAACADDCGQSAIVSPCELYCGCMASYCADEVAALASWDCMATCQDLDAPIRDCRRNHCEFGLGAAHHCMHASDRLHVCLSQQELGAEARTSPCLDGNESTWACDHDSDCCSEVCTSGGCQ